MSNYDSYTKTVVYKFGKTNGGLGDLTKFFMHLLNLCIQYKIKLYYLLTDDPVDKYLKLKYEKMYIKNINGPILNSIHEIDNIQENTYYIVRPQLMYYNTQYNNITMPLCEIFKFTDEVKLNTDIQPKYISIHLRLGDKFLETDPNYIEVKNDTRNYNEYKLYKFIENNSDKCILFFCDNASYKRKIKEKYNYVTITNYEIGHTSLTNTTDNQTLNSITDFYLLSNSEHIYKASYSGFSIMASKFKNIPITDL